MTRSVLIGLLGTLVLVWAAVPACGGSGVGGGLGTTGGASCSSVCQSGQNVAPSLGCTMTATECIDECSQVQQAAAAAGCSAEFSALASCMVNGGAAAWECDPGADEMEPADTGPCASQTAELDACEAINYATDDDTTEGTGGGVGEEG